MIDKGLIDLLSSFKPITKYNYNLVYPYYNVWFTTRKYSRFFQSILILSKYVNVPTYYFGIIDDCLCVLKKKYISNPVLYLIMPPIHIKGDIKKELDLISLFASHGVKTYLSCEDLDIYNIKPNDCNKITNNFEFIYDSKLFVEDIYKLKDSSYGNIRYYINNFKKNIDNIILDCRNTTNNDIVFKSKLNNLYKDWTSLKGLKADNYQNELDSLPNLSTFISSISYSNDKLESFGITEEVSKGQVIIVNRFTSRDYSLVKNLSIATHYIESAYWDSVKPNTLMNIGIGGTEKLLTEHKHKLKPVKLLQIYQNKIDNKLNKETWDNVFKIKNDIEDYL